MKKKVIVLGGGVAGMSAAHELVERGFDVEVFEGNRQYAGGKARSVNVPDTNTQFPDKFLPGEHGFRFFPGFYKHVTDTMKRIPQKIVDGKPSKENCFDNLEDTQTIKIARYNLPPIVFPTNFLGSWKSLKMVYQLFKNRKQILGLKPGEAEFFGKQMFTIMASCDERRHEQYEQISWWDFMDADKKSDPYQKLLVIGITRTLVAADAHKASTKTDGNIIIQLLYNFVNPTIRTDRVFNAPTNNAWIDPWYDYLLSKGVVYHKHANMKEFFMGEDGKINSVRIHLPDENKSITVSGDYYLLAVPADRADEVISDEMKTIDPALGRIKELVKDMSWMTGMQFYLNKEVNINPGHVNYAYTQWALTSFDQMHFWKNYDLKDRFNGKVKSILSVDISDWTDPDQNNRIADEDNFEEIRDEVWTQLEESLNRPGNSVIDKSMIEFSYLDRDIIIHKGSKSFNKERMLVNTVDSWKNRPEATTQIPNLFLASDYVQTYTDLATMEAANEAARRAVNGIIDASGSNATKCELWKLDEPALLNPIKWYDRIRYRKDPNSKFKFPLWLKIVMIPWGIIFGIYFLIRVLIFKITGMKPA
jgi:uncharacterized protein with NAD-binding domain and iron-sulfur cluster